MFKTKMFNAPMYSVLSNIPEKELDEQINEFVEQVNAKYIDLKVELSKDRIISVLIYEVSH